MVRSRCHRMLRRVAPFRYQIGARFRRILATISALGHDHGFARIAQNYAVRASDFVRNRPTEGRTPTGANFPRAARISRKGRQAREYKPLPVDDSKVRQPDISRAKEILGWQPRVDFEEG